MKLIVSSTGVSFESGVASLVAPATKIASASRIVVITGGLWPLFRPCVEDERPDLVAPAERVDVFAVLGVAGRSQHDEIAAAPAGTDRT